MGQLLYISFLLLHRILLFPKYLIEHFNLKQELHNDNTVKNNTKIKNMN